MRLLFIILLTVPALVTCCKFLSAEDKPKGLEERALDSEIVLAAYTRSVFKDNPPNNTTTTNYTAEFLVFNILKGEPAVSQIFIQRKPSSLETALNRRLANVTGFGDPAKCQSDVFPGETYILYLELRAGQLAARYDGVYGPAVLYSRDKELALEAIGGRPWSDWSACSGSCGGGLQQRKRQCDSQECGDEGQQRTCNMFACTEVLNVLDQSPSPSAVLGPSPRRQLPSGSWRSKDEDILFPRTFPWEFSLLVTLRARSSSSGGFLLKVLHSAALQVGLYISDSLTLVLSDKDAIRVTFVKSLSDGLWHQLAFSVRRDTVQLYLDCEYGGRLPVPGKIRPFGGKLTTVIVGSTGRQELDVFQGELEQLTVAGSPDAAAKQCNSTTEPLSFRSKDVARREEAWSRTFTSGTQNDQLPLRGDIIDDEDFAFEETGSGQRGTDDDYDYDDDKATTVDVPKEKEKIPLKAETPVTSNEVTSAEEDEDDSPSYDDYDYNRPDEETDDDDKSSDVTEGSGSSSDYDLAWSEWSPCSSTCSWGKRTRTSYCSDNGPNLEICNAASSKKSETETCFLTACPATTTSTTTAASVALVKVPMKKPKCEIECFNGGTCEAPRVCHCTSGFHGSLCQYVKQSCKVNCRNGGTCKPPMTCVCPVGFFGNECQYGCGQPCKKGSRCQQLQQERNCKCPAGYMPPNCSPLCKPSCLNGGACLAPNKCRCKPGYVGKSCHKAICEQGCKNGGECVAPNKCACRSGYGGKDCSQPLCEPRCQNGGECVKPYFCHCPPGAKGAFCEKLLCKPECRNGGTCIGPGKCLCQKGYSGQFCEKAGCLGGCKNGGKCGKTGKCSCSSGYSGIHCEIRTPCKFVEVKEPYKRGYKQKVTTQVKVPCGAWNWKQCTKTKVHYAMVYKTFFRTIYKCEDMAKSYNEAYLKRSQMQ